MKIKKIIKRVLPEVLLDECLIFINNFISLRPKKIIEHMEVDFALSRVWKKRDIKVLDIGAHHGEFLDIFGTFNHSHKWLVYCVEPLARNRKFLKRKIRKYKSIVAHIIPYGISDVAGQKTFFLGSADTLFTCNSHWKNIFPEHFADSQEIAINCLTVNDLVARYQIPENEHFDLIKVDVEGHDINVIDSFCKSGITSTVIIFEISNDCKITSKCIDLLRLKGFNEFFLFGRIGIPTTYIGEYIDEVQLQNLLQSGRIAGGNMVGFSE
jgi:FkbM family methyltransferase